MANAVVWNDYPLKGCPNPKAKRGNNTSFVYAQIASIGTDVKRCEMKTHTTWATIKS